MQRPVQVDQHNRLNGVDQKHVLSTETLGGAEHVSRPGTRLRAEVHHPTRPITPFEVDAHTSRMTEYELVLIRRYYHVPDYVQFCLLGLANVRTRPPPDFISSIYQGGSAEPRD